MKISRLIPGAIAALVLLGAMPADVLAADAVVTPPADDETLIYLIEEKGMGGVKFGISVNGEFVARTKHKQHTITRAKAGRLTFCIWRGKMVLGAIALDDRPGETVYLRHKWGNFEIFEISANEAAELMQKTKPAKIEKLDGKVTPPEVQILTLANIGRLGFDLMKPATGRLEPDDESAVITLFRRQEIPTLSFSIWSERGLVASLEMNDAVDVRVPAGEHFFFSTQTGTTVLRAQVEAGQHYFAWLDVGKLRLNLKLKPVSPDQADALKEWMALLQWVELDEAAMTPLVQERIDEVNENLATMAERARNGTVGFQELDATHIFASAP